MLQYLVVTRITTGYICKDFATVSMVFNCVTVLLTSDEFAAPGTRIVNGIHVSLDAPGKLLYFALYIPRSSALPKSFMFGPHFSTNASALELLGRVKK